MAKQTPISVGFQWRNQAGKSWVVTGLRPGGICEIHQIGRMVTGETQTRIVRANIEAGTAIPMATSDEARVILRRCNG